MKKHTREQDYIDNLENRVRDAYDEVRRNVRYSGKGRCGEIDLMGKVEGGGWDIYEVKATPSKKKFGVAREQLTRAGNCSPYNVNDMYIYVGRTDELIYEGNYRERYKRTDTEEDT